MSSCDHSSSAGNHNHPCQISLAFIAGQWIQNKFNCHPFQTLALVQERVLPRGVQRGLFLPKAEQSGTSVPGRRSLTVCLLQLIMGNHQRNGQELRHSESRSQITMDTRFHGSRPPLLCGVPTVGQFTHLVFEIQSVVLGDANCQSSQHGGFAFVSFSRNNL